MKSAATAMQNESYLFSSQNMYVSEISKSFNSKKFFMNKTLACCNSGERLVLLYTADEKESEINGDELNVGHQMLEEVDIEDNEDHDLMFIIS